MLPLALFLSAFDFDALAARARALAHSPYVAALSPHDALLDTIDYDAYNHITFRPGRGLLPHSAYELRLFHMGRFAKLPVKLHVIDGPESKALAYDKRLFDFSGGRWADSLPADLGYAGFRLMHPAKADTDWLAFLGASYFRSAGELDQYGLSARGIAIDSGLDGEEFPRFSEVWLEPHDRQVLIYALLEGPSVTGAYRMTAELGRGAVMDIEARLFMRKTVRRLGIAPLTSMYWFSEADKPTSADWRPEIHDSDGLALWTGTGERIWRPLVNPPRATTNTFSDEAPKGFGLCQRDRDFTSYQDDGVFYERRPTAWVEPLDDWGKGQVQLVELPTDDETNDNVVAYWQPAVIPAAGGEARFHYKLYWRKDEPYPQAGTARAVATRMGQGGVAGQPRPLHTAKFVVDFEGGALDGLDRNAKVEPVVSVQGGKLGQRYVLPVVGTKRWRAVFDVITQDGPVDLRLYLRGLKGNSLKGHGAKREVTLSETWLWQHHPRAGAKSTALAR